MAFTVRMLLSSVPRMVEVASIVDAAAWATARWAAPRIERVPCCLACGGVRYVPDAPASTWDLHVGDELLRRGRASCGEVVAYHLGIERAKLGLAGRDPAHAGRPRVVEQRADILHVVVELPDGRVVDPSRELKEKVQHG